MSFLARLHAERAALAARWARRPASPRLLEIVIIAIVLLAAALFVWVVWTQPMSRR
jgi:hypothetical protein